MARTSGGSALPRSAPARLPASPSARGLHQVHGEHARHGRRGTSGSRSWRACRRTNAPTLVATPMPPTSSATSPVRPEIRRELVPEPPQAGLGLAIRGDRERRDRSARRRARSRAARVSWPSGRRSERPVAHAAAETDEAGAVEVRGGDQHARPERRRCRCRDRAPARIRPEISELASPTRKRSPTRRPSRASSDVVRPARGRRRSATSSGRRGVGDRPTVERIARLSTALSSTSVAPRPARRHRHQLATRVVVTARAIERAEGRVGRRRRAGCVDRGSRRRRPISARASRRRRSVEAGAQARDRDQRGRRRARGRRRRTAKCRPAPRASRQASVTEEKPGLTERRPLQGRVAHHPAVAQLDRAVGVGGQRGVVGHQHQGRPARAVQAREQLDDLRAGGGVEVAGGLVGEQEGGPRGEGAGERDALLLAARELAG